MKNYGRYALCIMSCVLISSTSANQPHLNDDLSPSRSAGVSQSSDGDRVQRVKGLFGRLFGRRSSNPKVETEKQEEVKPVPKVVPLSRASSVSEEKRVVQSLRTANTQVVQKIQMESGFEDGFAETETLIPSPSVVRLNPASEAVKSSAPQAAVVNRNTSGGSATEYVVRPGDSLLLIARNLYQDPSVWTKIRDLNGLSSNVIHVGQRLKLPAIALAARPQNSDVSPATAAIETAYTEATRLEDLFPADRYRFKIYRVGTGDTLSSIASREMGSARLAPNLGRFNDIAPNGYLIAGQSLVVPIRKE
ncbi:MAG: LysM peptidoglycan-binding domain-containing protein [Candidatus Cloacimonetes bacterium]|nr:LysM peptidoglycan-binding domain-containing protein [Candidatus Cloacimonadota bacterium]